MTKIHDHAQQIIKQTIADNMPTQAVTTALKNHRFTGKIHLVAIGKAAWTMAKAATDYLGDRLVKGIVITKYGHSQGELPRVDVYEAGHPVVDENTIAATQKCINMAEALTENDELLFLISGGGSALFEAPADGVTLSDLQDISSQLLKSGADIVEINMIRKRLSRVKAGRFAQFVAPAKIYAAVLSDVIYDRLDTIASGPAAPDKSTAADAFQVVEKYNLNLTESQMKLLMVETPKEVTNVRTNIIGSSYTLRVSAMKAAEQLGYNIYHHYSALVGEAREEGEYLARLAEDVSAGIGAYRTPFAYIAAGETVVTVKGNGKGGRNQEMAFAAAKGIAGLPNAVFFSLGSDGTDGPTDAAGGIVDGTSFAKLKEMGVDYDRTLADNDTYNGLNAIDGLIFTGPTGTNVNDVSVVLVG